MLRHVRSNELSEVRSPYVTSALDIRVLLTDTEALNMRCEDLSAVIESAMPRNGAAWSLATHGCSDAHSDKAYTVTSVHAL